MNLEELAPSPSSKKLAEVTQKTFGFSVDISSLTYEKALLIKESFTKKLEKLNEALGATASQDKRYYEAKLVVETIDTFIAEQDQISDEAQELVLFGENDSDLYRQRTVPIQKNLSKKFVKGVYDSQLAVKLWKYWADDAAKRYSAQHSTGNDWKQIFSVSDRMMAASYMEDNWREELEAGNAMESAPPVSEAGPYGIEDSNNEIIMGFVNQWTEAGQPDDYMDDLIAYVKKTIPDSKDWKYAASLIKNGVKSYQDREYGTSSLMGLRNNTESVEVTQENIIVEGEMEAAESVMAAKNIVDRIQGMMEDLGEIVNEDLPALTDTITDNQGAEMAQNYSAAVSGAVNAALEAIRAAREGVDGAARMLTGEAVAPAMGADPAAEMPMEPTTDMDMALPAEEEIPATDEIATSDAATGGEEELGRERRV
jgi:hypothetical protein